MAHMPLPTTLTMGTLPSPPLATLQVAFCCCLVSSVVHIWPHADMRDFVIQVLCSAS